MREHPRQRHDVPPQAPQRLSHGGLRYFRDLLPSGLRVVTVEAPHLHTAMLATYVRVGSRHEREENNGVSHFLEHMFFRGSKRYPDTLKMNARVEAAGGNLNGITARDHGYYYTPIHPSHLKVGVSVLGDMLTRPRFACFEVEREIILEEMLDEVDERGRDIDLDNLSKAALFSGHPLSLKIAGTPGSVKRLTRRQLWRHLERHYVAENLVFAASGQVRREEVLELVERAFRALPAGARSTEQAPEKPPPGPRLQLVEHQEAQTELRLNFLCAPEPHPDFPALQLIRRVLDDGLSSRLPFQVVEKRGLAYAVHASLEAFHDVGIFEVEGASAPGKAGQVITEMCRTLAELCEKRIAEGELARAKQRHRILLEFSQDSTGELAGWYGGTELFRRPESFEQRCRLIEAQTSGQLLEVARRTFRKENLTLVAVGPRTGARKLERAAAEAGGLPD